MDARDLQQIDAFLADLGQASLLEYYGITAETATDEVKARIKSKRSWAQAQQANPKFRFQAMWLIKNNALVQRVLIEEMKVYVEAVAARERDRKLQMLDLFVQGSLVSGKLSSEAEAAIRRQASEMGLTEPETSRYLEEKVGADDQESLFEEPKEEADANRDDFIDYYELLEISPQATAEEVEVAYRERYRWARTLKDLQRANEIYRQLEQAWRVLSDMGRRRDYDDQRRQREQASSAPSGTPVVPAALRANTSPTPPAPPRSGQSEHSEPVEPPSELRLGRPQWARESASKAQPDPLTLAKPSASKPSVAPAPRPAPAREPEPSAPLPDPPVELGGRTFQPGTPEAPAKPQHTPQLSVEGPDQIAMGMLFKPVVRTIKVSNSGRGRLRGNVASSQPWLQVSPRTLVLEREPQHIELRAYPRRLPGRSGRARVTISTTHGERWAINVDAYKRSLGGIIAGAATILVLLLLVLDRQGVVPIGIFPPPEPEVIHTILQLEVEPPKASILLNGAMAGKGPARIFQDPIAPGEPLVLRVELDGRESYEERMVFVDRQRIKRTIKLVEPGLGPSYAVDPETGQKIVSSTSPVGATPPPPPPEAPAPPPAEPAPPAPDEAVPDQAAP
jgi:predicted transcriptional regulator